MRLVFLVISSASFLFCHAQVVQVTPAYTRSGVFNTTEIPVLSVLANQAALAGITHFAAGAYSERRFLLQELALYQLAVALPTSSGTFGLQAARFGDAAFSETKLGLGYGRKLGEKVKAGAQFNYLQYQTARYGTAGTLTVEAGLLFQLTEQLQTGLHVANPVGATIGKQAQDTLAAVYAAGLGYRVSDPFYIGAEIIKTEDLPVDVQVGMRYWLDPKLAVAAGIATATGSFYFGAGVGLKGFQLDAVATVHPRLGITPGLMLTYKGGTP